LQQALGFGRSEALGRVGAIALEMKIKKQYKSGGGCKRFRTDKSAIRLNLFCNRWQPPLSKDASTSKHWRFIDKFWQRHRQLSKINY